MKATRAVARHPLEQRPLVHDRFVFFLQQRQPVLGQGLVDGGQDLALLVFLDHVLYGRRRLLQRPLGLGLVELQGRRRIQTRLEPVEDQVRQLRRLEVAVQALLDRRAVADLPLADADDLRLRLAGQVDGDLLLVALAQRLIELLLALARRLIKLLLTLAQRLIELLQQSVLLEGRQRRGHRLLEALKVRVAGQGLVQHVEPLAQLGLAELRPTVRLGLELGPDRQLLEVLVGGRRHDLRHRVAKLRAQPDQRLGIVRVDIPHVPAGPLPGIARLLGVDHRKGHPRGNVPVDRLAGVERKGGFQPWITRHNARAVSRHRPSRTSTSRRREVRPSPLPLAGADLQSGHPLRSRTFLTTAGHRCS